MTLIRHDIPIQRGEVSVATTAATNNVDIIELDSVAPVLTAVADGNHIDVSWVQN